jgi:hypothetical protein
LAQRQSTTISIVEGAAGFLKGAMVVIDMRCSGRIDVDIDVEL